MRCCALAVQQACRRQHEGTRANRRDAPGSACKPAHRRAQLRLFRPAASPLASGSDEGVKGAPVSDQISEARPGREADARGGRRLVRLSLRRHHGDLHGIERREGAKLARSAF